VVHTSRACIMLGPTAIRYSSAYLAVASAVCAPEPPRSGAYCVVPRTSVRVCVMRDGEFLFATACRMSIQSFGDLPLWLFMIII